MRAIITINEDKIIIDGVEFLTYGIIRNDLISNIYKEYSQIIETSENKTDNLYTYLAKILKKGDKLEICTYNIINKLNIYDIHQYWVNSKNGKYIDFIPELSSKLFRTFTDRTFTNYNENISIMRYGYQFFPKIDAWYNDNKLLNKPNLEKVIEDYVYELNHELFNFENLVSYKEHIKTKELTLSERKSIIYSNDNLIFYSDIS